MYKNNFVCFNATVDKIISAIKNGAKVVKKEYWNKVEYGVEYPTGGYFRITKAIYNKVSK